jgi:hypothetical protein
MMHSSKSEKWRKSVGTRRIKYDREGVNMRVEIIIAVWQKNYVLTLCL